MNEALFTANNVWMLVATALVLYHAPGLRLLEAGFVTEKNTVNILFRIP